MAPFAPFETSPHLAIGVSGGADSMALCLLAAAWARARGGTVTALTVDHGLRPEAALEAAQVGRWLRRFGIPHRILHWTGAKPDTGIQAAARVARRELLSNWCRQYGVLHLLLAHHAGDQAETVRMREDRGPGDGAAGMAAITETGGMRILRPLLGIGRGRLAACLEALGQPWIEDPSNEDPRFERVRVRMDLARAGHTAAAALIRGRAAGAARANREGEIAGLLANAVRLDPLGYAETDPDAIAAAPRGVALGALARLLRAVGGSEHGPRRAKLNALLDWITAGAGRTRTLGGCTVRREGSRLLVCREAGRIAPTTVAHAGETLSWDGRFRVTIPARLEGRVQIVPLGRAGAKRAAAALPGAPRQALETVPAVSVEGVRYPIVEPIRPQGDAPYGWPSGILAVFAPRRPLSGARFCPAPPCRGG